MLNEVKLIGNVGKDPEVRYIDNGNCVANFSLATTKKWKDKQGKINTETQWHKITLWGEIAKIAEKYVKKGSPVCICGEIKYKEYEKDNVKHFYTEIQGDKLILLGYKDTATEAKPVPEVQPEQPENLPPSMKSADDLPF